MCFHHSSDSQQKITVPSPAAAAAPAPQSANVTGMDTIKERAGSVKAKGKRRLTIPVASSNSGTGINV